MAEGHISVTESQFRCPICLDVLREPASIPCGHTYCMACIRGYWDRAERSRCPQCREAFSPRPALRKNTVLADLLDGLQAGDEPPDGPEEKHRRGAEGGDRDEAHGVDAHRARRQVQLLETQRVVQARIRSGERELEEFQQSLESLKASASAVLEDSETLFADMALRLEKTKVEVRATLEARERVALGRAEYDVETMERNLEELRGRDQEIGRLLEAQDLDPLEAVPLLSIPVPPRASPLPAEALGGARRALGLLRARLDQLLQEEVDNIRRAVNDSSSGAGECVRVVPASFPLSSPSLQPADQRMRDTFLRYSVGLSLDQDTAHPTLVLLEAPQGARCGEEPQAYPSHPQRFDSVAQVLAKDGHFGPAYWEVEWRGGGWVDIGVTYRGIGRKGGGKPCLLGRNQNSWRLRCTHAGYAAWHDNRKTTVAAPPCARIGVFLESHRGALSFYAVSDALVLLHTFRCPFSQPLYPAFRLDLDSTLLICPREAGAGGKGPSGKA